MHRRPASSGRWTSAEKPYPRADVASARAIRPMLQRQSVRPPLDLKVAAAVPVVGSGELPGSVGGAATTDVLDAEGHAEQRRTRDQQPHRPEVLRVLVAETDERPHDEVDRDHSDPDGPQDLQGKRQPRRGRRGTAGRPALARGSRMPGVLGRANRRRQVVEQPIADFSRSAASCRSPSDTRMSRRSTIALPTSDPSTADRRCWLPGQGSGRSRVVQAPTVCCHRSTSMSPPRYETTR